MKSSFFHSLKAGFTPGVLAVFLLAIVGGLFAAPAEATIVYRGFATGSNTGLPTDGSAGALVITRPAFAKPGMVMIVSIAARPSQMTWVAPAGWTQLSVATEQLSGGVSTDPGGMTLKSYYRIVGTSEPVSYTWTFANTIGVALPYCNPNPPSYSNCSAGGSAVGGMLVFSGVDTSTSPLDATPTSKLNASGTIHQTTAVTTVTANAVVVSMISYLSASSFAYSGTLCGTVEALDVSAPTLPNAVGTTLQMGYFTKATAGVTCSPQATAASSADTGIGHLLALRPSLRDLSIDMTRNVPLSQGGTASYTLTANNEGGLSEPGPLSIVNTLPTGLTLASYSGSGWSCVTAGQVVTCTKIGALATGTSATPLVLNVNVSATANGVLTNSATVSGTGGDGNSSNDTAVDTYVILPTPYAYYKLDEALNTTSFADTSGGANATALGTAVATGNPPATVGAAIAGSPGTCGAVKIPVGTTAIGVNTGINVNTIGNAGTIAFWYVGNTAWNDGTARMLFDASNELGSGATSDKHFFLAKDGAGKLIFALEDSADLDSTASSPSYNHAANTWHHIAVTWDLAADQLYIYLDGDTNPVATSATNVNGALGTLATLYLGAQRYTTITGTPAGYTSNTANGYLDEVRIYSRALAPLEIAAVAALTHACAATVDHFELSLPTASSACTPVVATVTACADTSSPCTNRQSAESGKTATLATSAGSLGTTSVIFDAIGQANTTLSYPAAATGATATVTLSGGQLPTGQASVFHAYTCCLDGVSCTAGSMTASSCMTTFTACSAAAANFNIVDSYYTDKGYDAAADHRIYTKLAGWNEVTGAAGNTTFKLDVIALKSGGTTETNYVGSGGSSKNVKLEIFDDSSGTACNSSAAACAACSKTVVATVNPVIFAATNAGYQNDVTVALGNTNAYSRLVARITDTNASPTVYGCSTDAFAVRPQTFTITATTSGDVAMPSTASGASATPVVKAGANFKMYADTATVGYDGTPTLSQVGVSDYLGSATANLLSGSFGAANSSTGKAGGTTFQYGEVGYFILAANAVSDAAYANTGASDVTNGDCVVGTSANTKTNGKYGCNVGSASTSWGRFTPDHFDVAVTQGCSAGGFTYSGQSIAVQVTARNSGGSVTQNYSSTTSPVFSKTVTLSDANAVAGSLSPTSVAASAFTAGVASPTPAFTFTVRETAPATIKLRAVDTDGVSSATGTEGAAVIRSGRTRLLNAYGSELLDLPMIFRTEYWMNATNGWQLNSADTCTGATLSFAAVGTDITGKTCVIELANNSGKGCAVAPTVANRGYLETGVTGTDSNGVAGFAGNFNLWLKSPGAGNAGSIDLTATVPAWLQYPWKSGAASNPSARATFGIYKSGKVIHRREMY